MADRDLDHDDLDRTREPRAGIDVDAVIRRSRARRRPKQLLLGGIATLAVVGLAVPVAGATGLFGGSGASTVAGDALPATEPQQETADEGPASATAPGGGDERDMSTFGSSSCGEPVATSADASTSELMLTVSLPASAEIADGVVTGTATLRNDGDARIAGTASPAPVVTLARDGVVAWRSVEPPEAGLAAIDLAPGASMTFAIAVAPLRCDPDDAPDASDADLDAAEPGDYEVSAALDIMVDVGPQLMSGSDDDASVATVLAVRGPAAEIALR